MKKYYFFILFLLFVPLQAVSKIEFKLEQLENKDKLGVSIYNYSKSKINLDYIMCVEPHSGISFLIEDMKGKIFRQSTTLNSGCSLSNKIVVDRYGISGKIIDKDLVDIIYSPPHKKLYVTALLCKNYFTMEKCMFSNKILVDF
ncbi:hypothetical protein [uncultured Shewanella sp.]|uniref:hypothetical protein n=1 Tax=uncultured Shewanella sp. TaxID=173975 RepID=UPI0026126F31|nr:hypothetical protein [uncultured Shewanella sp.]